MSPKKEKTVYMRNAGSQLNRQHLQPFKDATNRRLQNNLTSFMVIIPICFFYVFLYASVWNILLHRAFCHRTL